MATVINNPSSESTGSGMGFLLGILMLVIFAIVFFVYLLPTIGNAKGPQVNVPGKIDVNVQTPNK